MITEKHRRLLKQLADADGWTTASEIGGALAVSTRSVRNYVSQIKQLHGDDLIVSSEYGYRVDADRYASLQLNKAPFADAPDRIPRMIHKLLIDPDNHDLYRLADQHFISDATLELDLRKVRSVLAEHQLELVRNSSQLSITGGEHERRRLLAKIHRQSHTSGFLELSLIADTFDVPGLIELRDELTEALDANGFQINELSLPDVLLEFAIAANRIRRGCAITSPVRSTLDDHEYLLYNMLDNVFARHLGVTFPDVELTQCATALGTRAATPLIGRSSGTVTLAGPEVAETVRQIVQDAASNYSVTLDNKEFLSRLTTHVGNVLARSRDNTVQYNPITANIKSSYPMVYDVSVYIASGLQQAYEIQLDEDEIAYIALHVGSQLEQRTGASERLSCTLVCPNYYGMQHLLRDRLEQALGAEIEVVSVVSRSDVDWSSLTTDLVVTTVPPRMYMGSVLVVQPFLTEHDVDRVRRVIRRLRDERLRQSSKARLLQYLRPELFYRNLHNMANETDVIRHLGAGMIDTGIVDTRYVEGVIERETLSSTVFSDLVAVPHAMTMDASQTTIAIMLNDSPVPWSDGKVQLVCMIAFAKRDRRLFQSVFDQFVEVFSQPGRVQHLIRTVTDFDSLVEQLAVFMDEH